MKSYFNSRNSPISHVSKGISVKKPYGYLFMKLEVTLFTVSSNFMNDNKIKTGF